jgi:hypothetical protein
MANCIVTGFGGFAILPAHWNREHGPVEFLTSEVNRVTQLLLNVSGLQELAAAWPIRLRGIVRGG